MSLVSFLNLPTNGLLDLTLAKPADKSGSSPGPLLFASHLQPTNPSSQAPIAPPDRRTESRAAAPERDDAPPAPSGAATSEARAEENVASAEEPAADTTSGTSTPGDKNESDENDSERERDAAAEVTVAATTTAPVVVDELSIDPENADASAEAEIAPVEASAGNQPVQATGDEVTAPTIESPAEVSQPATSDGEKHSDAKTDEAIVEPVSEIVPEEDGPALKKEILPEAATVEPTGHTAAPSTESPDGAKAIVTMTSTDSDERAPSSTSKTRDNKRERAAGTLDAVTDSGPKATATPRGPEMPHVDPRSRPDAPPPSVVLDGGSAPAIQTTATESEHAGTQRLHASLLGRTTDRPVRGNPGPAVDQARLIERVTRALQSAQGRGEPLRLRLSPPELGSLRLEVRVQGGAMVARVEAESSAARSLLVDNLPLLKERLAEQGVRLEQFDVQLPDQRGGNSQDLRQPDERQRDRGGSSRQQEPRDEPREAARDESERSTRPQVAIGKINIIV